MLRIGVIGAGEHSSLHHGAALQSYRAAHPGEIELTAVADLDSGKARAYADRYGFLRFHGSYDDMYRQERLDGVVAVTPINRTAEIVPDLLRRRVPLLIEKPPGESSADTRRLLAAAEATGTPHTISFNRRFIPAVVKAREWMAGPGGGRAAKIVTARMLRKARREADFAVGTGIHVIDAVLFFLGAPERIHTLKTPTDHEGRFFWSSVFSFRGGAGGIFLICPDVGTVEETLEIHGQDYCIQIDTAGCGLRVFDGGKETLSWRAPEGSEFAFRVGAIGETEAFVRALREGKGFGPDLREGLVSMIAAEAVETGGEILVPRG